MPDKCPHCDERHDRRPESPIMQACIKHRVKLVLLRRRLRNDSGPSGELGDYEEFVRLDGRYYPVAWIKSAPGLSEEFIGEFCSTNQPATERK